MEAIGDVITLKNFSISNDLSESLGPSSERPYKTTAFLTTAVYPSNPVLDSDECNKRAYQSDPSYELECHSERVSQSNAGEDQSERFLQLNWKEMVGVLANQVTAMLKTITNQTLPVESFLQS